ncbi:type I phosphodiesterase/nucleotide pyrophosphatase [Knoellia remsis]|uniref:Type I phosphodiesterase/nucleotide pyrophosphatase n=1 Tax=Knoellia remsis TaxID=407159 RepID=A0A2T0UXF4_9MICO|nr:nucleotide pyrophosphatase/phosphodiesterase family protein [Knoellia remsis]PRY62606.1 type I phosphodiesterase/nucleotide pyrophosphatase [Knoellia remsis]
MPPAPAYADGGLPDVLPSVVASLGVGGVQSLWQLPPARSAVVVLVDGLGHDLLRRRGGHAPWLRSLFDSGKRIVSGFPSTTPVSMGSFGTGLAPGAHGMVGFEVLVPGEDRLLNELSWEDGPVPELWQPRATWFERAAAAGVDVVRIGPGFFDGSGLTRAALRGGRFVAANSLEARVDATLAHVRSQPAALTYLYWGDLDKVGHVHGCESWQWGDELESIDRELARLADGLPSGCSLTITADHGMVDVPMANRLDLAHDGELADGIRHVGGEPRAPQLYCETGALDDVLATWTARVGEFAWVMPREEAVGAGLFGAVAPEHVTRIGDVVVAMRGPHAVVDSRHHRPELLALIGLHGSLTDDEVPVPLFHVPARGV